MNMCSGINHMVMNIGIVIIFIVLILFILDFLPDVDHFVGNNGKTKIRFDLITLKNLARCYFKPSLGCETAEDKRLFHNPIIPLILILIGIIWLVHIYFDYLWSKGLRC